jgi:hypothetical protein
LTDVRNQQVAFSPSIKVIAGEVME